ncbi:hypothetical protein OF83DRAFT_413852 [Amylostereum chailletii]|nr:hypothetical protein OF83DRAFT_413852 [Amylostereum chailletii]
MAQFDPGDFALPEFVDPFLDYLSNVLPPPVYSFILNLSSHALALAAATLRLSQALVASKPWEWDAQTVLPPLITLLAAYLALVSAYRTATWMVRTFIFFIKWGTILSALVGGAGWYIAQQRAQGNDLGGWGQSGFTGVLFDVLAGKAGQTSSPRTRSSSPRPKAHESFERHREWQYEQDQEAKTGSADDVQKFVDQIVDKVTEGTWFGMAKGLVGSFAQGRQAEDGEGKDGRQRRQQPRRKAKAKRKAATDSDDVEIDDLD